MSNHIPGWMKARDLQILSTLSSLCPEFGSILEIGSFLGRSTYSLYKNKKESVKLSVIDKFEITPMYNTNIESFKSKLDGNITLAVEAAKLAQQNNSWRFGFKLCLGDEIYSNIDVNVCDSNDFKKTTDYDLVFIDGAHDRDTVLCDIEKFITPTNLLVGDDFGKECMKFAGLIDAVSYSKIKYNRTLVCLDNSRLWILVPNSGYWKNVLGIKVSKMLIK